MGLHSINIGLQDNNIGLQNANIGLQKYVNRSIEQSNRKKKNYEIQI